MKIQKLVFALILGIVISSSASAEESTYGKQVGHQAFSGVANIIMAPTEPFVNAYDVQRGAEWYTKPFLVVVGGVLGTVKAPCRVLVGAVHLVFSPLPVAEETWPPMVEVTLFDSQKRKVAFLPEYTDPGNY